MYSTVACIRSINSFLGSNDILQLLIRIIKIILCFLNAQHEGGVDLFFLVVASTKSINYGLIGGGLSADCKI